MNCFGDSGGSSLPDLSGKIAVNTHGPFCLSCSRKLIVSLNSVALCALLSPAFLLPSPVLPCLISSSPSSTGAAVLLQWLFSYSAATFCASKAAGLWVISLMNLNMATSAVESHKTESPSRKPHSLMNAAGIVRP